MSRPAPNLRSPVRPFLVQGTSGLDPSGLPIQLGLWARWATQASGRTFSFQRTYIHRPTILALESSATVIPRSIFTSWRIDRVPILSRSTPAWRGIPCQWGHALAWLQNTAGGPTNSQPWEPFSVLALLPASDPPDLQTPHILLGTRFFRTHSTLRLSLRYGDIQTDPATAGPDARFPCGEIRA